jgi:Sulfotransferase domain
MMQRAGRSIRARPAFIPEGTFGPDLARQGDHHTGSVRKLTAVGGDSLPGHEVTVIRAVVRCEIRALHYHPTGGLSFVPISPDTVTEVSLDVAAHQSLAAVEAEVDRAVVDSSWPKSRPSMSIAPNFFIVGAPKSGTTALSQYLGTHPNVFFSPVKEPHFFDLDTSKRVKAGLQTYLSLFSQAEPDLHTAVGEGSTGYLFSKVAVSEILKFNPDSKFIVMLRNPVDLVHAWHSEMYYEGIEDIVDFERAWRLEGERREGRRIPYACWEPKKLLYSEWGKLGDQVERLLSVVARDRLKVIVFDDFVADTRGVYEQVLSFLGVPLAGKDVFETVNESRVLRYPWLQRSVAYTANQVRRIRAISGLNLKWGLGFSQRLLLLNSKPSPRRSIPVEFRAELNEFFREDVHKLSKLVDRDLSYWVEDPRRHADLNATAHP